MKQSTLQQHKEVAMLWEEGLITTKARSAFSIPQSMKQVTPMKTKSNIRKIDKHYTNCGVTNHNVETCEKKKEQTMVATTKATQPSQKP
jgi:hypothetical protein